jgi:hypothetical protein
LASWQPRIRGSGPPGMPRLNAGTPGPRALEWAGHSVEVLGRIYAHRLDGEDGTRREHRGDATPQLRYAARVQCPPGA